MPFVLGKKTDRPVLRVAPTFQPFFRELGIDAEAVFDHPLIKPWRTLPADRQNCTLDAKLDDGRSVRWHVKRYAPPSTFARETPAANEMHGYRALNDAKIPTATLVAWGRLPDGRSFVISEDLAHYEDTEKLLRGGGAPFDALLEPTADLAAKLHTANLHHRDLYLCHFFTRREPSLDVRLIDVARVRKMTNPLTRRRWIVKDLAQFWFSTTSIPSITDAHRTRWLERYASQRGGSASAFRSAIERKSNWIARHDEQLRRDQPDRNVSLTSSTKEQ